MQKLAFISNMPAPYQVKFCYALNEYFDAQFWFYEGIRSDREQWWKIPLGEKCKIIPHVYFKSSGRYYTKTHLQWLKKFNPDIVILGGFSIPANFSAYNWAKRNNKKVVVYTEISRTKKGALRQPGWEWGVLKTLYQDIDAVFAINTDSYHQFRDFFGFGEKVKLARYASDLEPFFTHALRQPKEAYNLLFANRLTELYNPLAAIRILKKVQEKYPTTTMQMNASGELRADCEALISELGLQNQVHFLGAIESWDEMHRVYENSDILLLPAKFSNGNFTIYEAMASGMGIVISDQVLGNGREVVNGENGFNVSLDEDLMAEKIIEYIETPALFHQHAAHNRLLVKPLGLAGTAALYASLLGDL